MNSVDGNNKQNGKRMKRLTKKHIKTILDSITIDTTESVAHSNRVLREELAKELAKVRIYRDQVPALTESIIRKFYKGMIPPGENVGVSAAQNIGERQTQLTLDTFHSTGMTNATVVTGVPRFAELLSATRNSNNNKTIIYPLDADDKTIEDIRSSFAGVFEYVDLKSLVSSFQVKDPCVKPWYKAFSIMYSDSYKEFDKHLELKIDSTALFKYSLTLKSIYHRIVNEYTDMACVYSPQNIGIIDIYYTDMDIQSIDNDIVPVDKYDLYMMKYKVMPKLLSLHISGVSGLSNIQYSIPACITADGNNLTDVMSCEGVDTTRTYCNNVWDIYTILGVEGTREFLIEEFISIISVDSYINRVHVELLVDCMLYTGSIVSVSRYGLDAEHFSVLSRSSFEESMEHFIKAAVNGEIDNVKSISSSIICGKVPRTGSGMCDLLFKQ